MTQKRISVIVACYRDAGSIQEMYKRLTAVLPNISSDYEIIYVNDASPDDAESVLAELAAMDSRLVIVNHTRNFGSQNAFLSGLKIVRGDCAVLMDGDLQDPPSLIPEFVKRWNEGFHIVYGVRVKRKETFFRQLSYKVFYRVFKRLSDISIPLDAGDFGLIDRRVIDCLVNDFPERLVFLRGLRAYTGFKHTGVEYVRDARFDGRSTNSFIGNVRWALLAVFSFSKRPLAYISTLAVVVVTLTIFTAIFYLIAYVIYGAPEGFPTILLVTLFLGSVQLTCFSILAEYLGHMYTELKGRPRYIIRDIVDNRKSDD